MNDGQAVQGDLAGEIKVGFCAVDYSSATEDGGEFRRPLECVTAAIVGDESSVLILSVDIGGFRPPVCVEMQKRIGKAVNVSPENILIHATHTHSAPRDVRAPGAAPFDAMVEIFIKGASKAIANAKPARVRAGHTDVGKSLSVHRRGDAGPDLGLQTFWYGYVYRDGDDRPDASALVHEMKSRWLGKKSEYKTDPESFWFDGPVDQLVHGISFEEMDGKPLGSIVRFSAHSHLACCLQNRIHDPDFPARVRDVMEEKIGGTCMFLLGPCANLVPKDKAHYKIDHDREPEGLYFGPSSALCAVDDDELLSETERIGREIAEAAIKAVEGVSPEPLESARFLPKPFAFPLNPVLPESREEKESIRLKLVPEYEAFLRAGGPLIEIRRLVNLLNWLRWSAWKNPAILTAQECEAGEKMLPVSALALNSTVMVFMFSEVPVQTTLGIREAYPEQDPWTISLTGGSTSYIPTAQMIDEGGYEGRATIMRRDGEEKLRVHICDMLKEMSA